MRLFSATTDRGADSGSRTGRSELEVTCRVSVVAKIHYSYPKENTKPLKQINVKFVS